MVYSLLAVAAAVKIIECFPLRASLAFYLSISRSLYPFSEKKKKKKKQMSCNCSISLSNLFFFQSSFSLSFSPLFFDSVYPFFFHFLLIFVFLPAVSFKRRVMHYLRFASNVIGSLPLASTKGLTLGRSRLFFGFQLQGTFVGDCCCCGR